MAFQLVYLKINCNENKIQYFSLYIPAKKTLEPMKLKLMRMFFSSQRIFRH